MTDEQLILLRDKIERWRDQSIGDAMTVATASTVFDLLETLADDMDDIGFDTSELRSTFARNTEGVEVEMASCAIIVVAERERGERRRVEADRLTDLRRLLLALGMGDHARPISPAQVFDLAIERATELRRTAEGSASTDGALGRHGNAGVSRTKSFLPDRTGEDR